MSRDPSHAPERRARRPEQMPGWSGARPIPSGALRGASVEPRRATDESPEPLVDETVDELRAGEAAS